jgi:hypothetical protein
MTPRIRSERLGATRLPKIGMSGHRSEPLGTTRNGWPEGAKALQAGCRRFETVRAHGIK